FAQLDRRLSEVSDSDREFMIGAFRSSLESLSTFDRLTGALANLKRRLRRIVSFQWRIHIGAGLMGLVGLGLAIGVPASRWNDPDLVEGPYLIGAGVFLLLLAVGAWSSANGLLTQKRTNLEAEVTSLAMPLELEGLKLSMLQLRQEELCRRFGYGSAEELAVDLSRYGRLRSLDGVDVFRLAQGELDRLTDQELGPLVCEVRQLLLAFPPVPGADPIAALGWIKKEMMVHTLGCRVAAVMNTMLEIRSSTLAKLKAELDLLETQVTRRLGRAGVGWDPLKDPARTIEELRRLETGHERWRAISHEELPRELARLLPASTFVTAYREARVLTRQVATYERAAGHGSAPGPLALSEPRLVRELARGRRRLIVLAERERRLKAEIQQRLLTYHRRLPALMARRNELLAARERALLFRDAGRLVLEELDRASLEVRGRLAEILNREAVLHWGSIHPALGQARFAPDLSLRLPAQARALSAVDWHLCHLSVRAAMALRSGPGQTSWPIGLLEPLAGARVEELARLLAFLTSQLGPDPQVVILTRRRSRYETVRFSSPALFKKIQLVEAGKLLAERRPRARPAHSLVAGCGRHA
ncbi:MAG: hypothetical protein HY815_25670, partial [Candidatus Riflebacteria bacterium]|nr:hypothetical protein [Candidatus Riflebacteria bacterium]